MRLNSLGEQNLRIEALDPPVGLFFADVHTARKGNIDSMLLNCIVNYVSNKETIRKLVREPGWFPVSFVYSWLDSFIKTSRKSLIMTAGFKPLSKRCFLQGFLN